MAEKLTIKERIGLQLVRELELLLPTWLDEEIAAGRATAEDKTDAQVQRLDPTGNDPPLFSPLIIESSGEVKEGGAGLSQNLMDVLVQVFLPVREDRDELPMAEQNRWIGRFIDALIQEGSEEALVEEATSEPLVTDIELVGYDTPVAVMKNQTDLVAEAAFRIDFQTYRHNPYQGPANTERTV